MREAIDYNALSWIRQEVGVTLKQARLELEEYAEGEQRKELLQGCAAHLHEARGPLRMVNIKGADMLACEMEEAIADLLLEAAVDSETMLEQLMQGFLELPEYLSNLRTGKRDNPRVLFPLINRLRSSRGLQPLKEDAIFSPDLAARMPVSVFDARADHDVGDLTALARSARVRFQGGLLEWYRDSGTNNGLNTLVEVLEHLQMTAGSEPAARLWWVGAGVAELLRDGVIEAKPAVKHLFGQLDRQIKRLMDAGEKVFSDFLADDLVKNLLFQLVGVKTDSPRITEIRSTFGIAAQDETKADSDHEAVQEIGDELLQVVSVTAREDIDRIKEQLDTLARTADSGAGALAPVADSLHSLANTLGMIGLDGFGVRLAEDALQLRNLVAADSNTESADFTALANTLVAVEDALSDITTHTGSGNGVDDHGEAVLRQGQQAVVSAVITDIADAKEAINEFLKSSSGFDLLTQVPVLLNKISGGLALVGEDRLAVAARQVRGFVSTELLGNHRNLNEHELDSLADAICSIEYCVEELSENHKYGERAIGVAVSSLEKLGYPDASLYTDALGMEIVQEPADAGAPETTDAVVVEPAPEHLPEPVTEAAQDAEPAVVRAAEAGNASIDDLQVVAPDADGEIVDIFIEEAGDVLNKLATDIPAWTANPGNRELLTEIRRAFHTIKGSGRMVGAMASGELSWAFENLLNKVIEGAIPANAAVLELIGRSTSALKDLVAQVQNPDTILLTDVNALASQAAQLSQPGIHGQEPEVPGLESEADAQEHAVVVETSDIEVAVEHARFDDDGRGLDAVAAAEPETPAAPEYVTDTVTASAPETIIVDDESVPAETEAPSGQEQYLDTAEVPVADVDALLDTAEHRDADVPGIVDLPVLKQDADPEIVEIFLEEANEELGSISLKIPEWIQRPDDAGLLNEIRRSLHTLKGSGRMAGAMVIGEFAWSIETLLNKLLEGAVQTGGSLFAMLSQVPQAVSSLLRQLQDGTVPDMDIDGMMQKAADLQSGSPAGQADQLAAGDVIEEADNIDGDVAAPDDDGDDKVLMELFSAECREHLVTLSDAAAHAGDSRMVSSALYRALHTLTGISESASMHGVGRLAAALYEYFGDLYQENRLAVPEAFEVLGDCVSEISAQLQCLPERGYDDELVSGLVGRIAALNAAAGATEHEPVQLHDGSASDADVPYEEYASSTAESSVEMQGPAGAALPVPDEQAEAPALADGEGPGLETAPGAAMDEAGGEPSAPELAAASPAQHAVDMYAGMDQELYEIFVEEATEIVDGSEAVLRNWSESPDNHELMADFQRLLHTLKGGARMVDMNAIGNLSHALESLLTRVADGAVPASDDLFSLLQESQDRLAEMVERVKSRTPVDAADDLESLLATYSRGGPDMASAESRAASPAVEEQADSDKPEQPDTVAVDGYSGDPERYADDEEEAPVAGAQDQPEISAYGSDTAMMAQAMAEKPQMVERRKEGRPRGELVRVQSDVLDNLVNNAGEINIYRARMEQQINTFRFNLTELDQTINRLRDQLRQLEMETEAQILFRYEQETENRNEGFDPLEMDRYSKLQQLSRSLIESISDLRSLQGLMETTTRDSETLLLQQSRVSTDLQEGLIRTRMIPFAGLAPRLRRIVRQSARQLDKKVDLSLRGAEGEMDRAVIERIVAPLEHMLRNAVAHGIEMPEQRKKAGKRVAGTITIDFNREGNEIVLCITDDGAGLDIDAIRARAIQRGLMSADADLPDTDVMQFVLQTGFSTASEVTQISGRGVGMDVVNSEVKQLGGSLHIHSESGKGSIFTIRLPYTLAINQALLITVGEQIFCVPMGSIEGVVTATPAQLQSCYDDDNQEFGYAGHNYQLMHLGSLLGICRMDLETAGAQIPVLLVRAGDKRIGMQVDSLVGSREVVIKPLGAQLSMVDGITGVTILGDGRVVMILDMFAVSRMKVREQATISPVGSLDDSRLVVMVVDDSITVRKVTSRLLERGGFRVLTAKDGVDAMGQLQEIVPDMMLLDIEMPRMDGFELATHMRNDERLRHVPIIMITSRTGDKHRDRAFEIGVNDYLGKPYQESELLASINNIIGVNTLAVGT